MITGKAACSASAPPTTPARWQSLWRDAVTDPFELLRLLGLSGHAAELLPNRDTGFPLRVPKGFIARMRHGDASDPLLLQVLPHAAELIEQVGYTDDPVGDHDAKAGTGVIHKYHGRSLLVATGSCAVHCRYCFRRHFPYAEETAATSHWQSAIDHLHKTPSVREVILSGGDPLSLSTAKLAELGSALETIASVRRLRIHTRLPVVLPERIDDELIIFLRRLPLQKIVVIHANHANEIDVGVRAACERLRGAGVMLLNQSVLLHGINDDVEALSDLSEALVSAGVTPYYLHQLDHVRGAAHFAVADARALEIVDGLRRRLPGYMVPQLVREVAGAPSKTPI